ncbi:hypothetical protein GCM10009786_21490 [Leucobacter alluvii]|uniref:Uncharacterized protein n=1 Tax=Leucobacter alluvii TaxID=340321 RepID=A0ABN3B754_9MICO
MERSEGWEPSETQRVSVGSGDAERQPVERSEGWELSETQRVSVGSGDAERQPMERSRAEPPVAGPSPYREHVRSIGVRRARRDSVSRADDTPQASAGGG